MHHERQDPDVRFSTDPARLDLGVIHGFLSTCYWSPGIPLAAVERAIRHSLPFGLYDLAPATPAQVGFARIITDFASFAYLCDVFILESHRGRGLSKRLMEFVLAHPDLQRLRRVALFTRDAHALYARYGFAPMPDPTRYMEIARPGVYPA